MTLTKTGPVTVHLLSRKTGEPHDPDLWAPLTDDERWIIRHHLTSGWHKIPAVHGIGCPLWWEIDDLISDLHMVWTLRHAPVLAGTRAGGQVPA